MHTYTDLFYAKDKDRESFRRSKKKGRIVMTITKKHLKELADIVYMAEHPEPADLYSIAKEIKSFAKRHAPNFDESRWNDYMHKLKKEEAQQLRDQK